MKTRIHKCAIIGLDVLALVSVLMIAIPARAQVRPIYDRGSAGLVQALKRLQTTARVMHTGAHPDDEDSGLLAYLARKEQARTSYLALNRGDGGQNVIGEELFESLGTIRTEELLQARRLDGGSQFFTRVMDYGFSKKREEAARIWGEREVLGDMVRAIRIFKPMVIISRFAGTPADGHGQHQLVGYLTPIAFKAAADPKEFPEQLTGDILPWQAKKLYVSQSFVPNPQNVPSLTVNTGEYDSLLGRSYFEIAMEGRSQHKSQEMGTLELRGKQTSGVRLLESTAKAVDKESSVFDGIDTSITGIAANSNDTSAPFIEKLKVLQATAVEALKSYDPYAPGKLVPMLARGYREAADAESATRNPYSKSLVHVKREEFANALMLASGTVVDALADTETIVAGDSTNVAVRVFAPDATEIKVVKAEVKVPQDWKSDSIAEPPAPPSTGFRNIRENARSASFFKLTTSSTSEPTQPYWLTKPRTDSTFDWSGAGESQSLPFQKPLAIAEVTFDFGGNSVKIEKEVEYRYADDIRGEIRRELNVVPAVTIGMDSNLLIAPTSSKSATYRLVMTVTNHKSGTAKGSAGFGLPSGWALSPKTADFELKKKGDKTALTFDLTIPANAKPNKYPLRAVANMDGNSYDLQVQETLYPHIQTHRIYTEAEITAQVLDLKVAPVRVGYIMGSGDKVPQAIRRLGLDVKMLSEKDLSTGDLSQFDTIVVGIRASQVRPDYIANNGRLNEFMNNGGTLIVQYQQQEFARLNLMPYPAKMEGNIRVVDENAPVKILKGDHPVFNFPNKIGDADWLNWVQERDLYCVTDFDATKYVPLLESHDEGEKESNGGMLYAQVGKGRFLYSSYSWFRQLPVGNPGAYRLFANMLSLPKSPAK